MNIWSIAVAAALLILFIMFAAVIRYTLYRLVDNRIANFQNDLVTRHFDEVQNIYQQMRGWRHDYHNHIQAMKAHIALGQTDELEQYLSGLDMDLTSVDTLVKTGNLMVDAILNSKLSLIKTKGITVNVKATVPSQLKVSEIDLCVLLGNLLDNAMEACLRIPNQGDRFIRVYIRTMKDQLYTSVSNASGGDIRKSGKRYLSTKDALSHGYGLTRIDRIAAKYGGYVNRQHEVGAFATEVLLPQ